VSGSERSGYQQTQPGGQALATGIAHPDSLDGYQVLGEDDAEHTVHVIAVLRDRLGAGRDTRWRGEVVAPVDVRPLRHLPPPIEVPGRADADQLRQWRTDFRAGRCFYRLGPGFVQIKDVREPGRFEIVTLTEPDLIGLFLDCLTPTRCSTLGQPARQALRVLAGRDLVLVVGEYAVTLPHRMRRWPVPANLV
jgi:hypothetical protein